MMHFDHVSRGSGLKKILESVKGLSAREKIRSGWEALTYFFNNLINRIKISVLKIREKIRPNNKVEVGPTSSSEETWEVDDPSLFEDSVNTSPLEFNETEVPKGSEDTLQKKSAVWSSIERIKSKYKETKKKIIESENTAKFREKLSREDIKEVAKRFSQKTKENYVRASSSLRSKYSELKKSATEKDDGLSNVLPLGSTRSGTSNSSSANKPVAARSERTQSARSPIVLVGSGVLFILLVQLFFGGDGGEESASESMTNLGSVSLKNPVADFLSSKDVYYDPGNEPIPKVHRERPRVLRNSEYSHLSKEDQKVVNYERQERLRLLAQRMSGESSSSSSSNSKSRRKSSSKSKSSSSRKKESWDKELFRDNPYNNPRGYYEDTDDYDDDDNWEFSRPFD